MRYLIITTITIGGLFAGASLVGAQSAGKSASPKRGEWPMWGGSPDRNMVSDEKNIPGTWDLKTELCFAANETARHRPAAKKRRRSRGPSASTSGRARQPKPKLRSLRPTLRGQT